MLSRRTVIGLLSLVCLAISGTTAVQIGFTAAAQDLLVGVTLRVGLILGAIWLAFEQIQTAIAESSWKHGLLALALLALLAIRPKIAAIALVILLVAGIVHWSLRLVSKQPTANRKKKR